MPRPGQSQTFNLSPGQGVQLFPAPGMQQPGIPGGQSGGQGFNILDLLQGGAGRVGDVFTNILSQTPLAPLVAPQQLTAEDGTRFKQALIDGDMDTINAYMQRMSPEELQTVAPLVQRMQQAGPETRKRYGGLIPERPFEGLEDTAPREPEPVDRPAGKIKFDPKQDLWGKLLERYDNDVEAAYPVFQEMTSGKALSGRGTQPQYSLKEAQISRRLRGQPTGEPPRAEARPSEKERQMQNRMGITDEQLKADFQFNYPKDDPDYLVKTFRVMTGQRKPSSDDPGFLSRLGRAWDMLTGDKGTIAPLEAEGQQGITESQQPAGQNGTISQLPEGAKEIGAYQGKPLFQTSDGRKFVGDY